VRQGALAGVSRSGLYYRAREESGENLALMHLLDEQYTRTTAVGAGTRTAKNPRRAVTAFARGGWSGNSKAWGDRFPSRCGRS
jgi:hypothetical protein